MHWISWCFCVPSTVPVFHSPPGVRVPDISSGVYLQTRHSAALCRFCIRGVDRCKTLELFLKRQKKPRLPAETFQKAVNQDVLWYSIQCVAISFTDARFLVKLACNCCSLGSGCTHAGLQRELGGAVV